jgi:hypothetical protein
VAAPAALPALSSSMLECLFKGGPRFGRLP